MYVCMYVCMKLKSQRADLPEPIHTYNTNIHVIMSWPPLPSFPPLTSPPLPHLPPTPPPARPHSPPSPSASFSSNSSCPLSSSTSSASPRPRPRRLHSLPSLLNCAGPLSVNVLPGHAIEDAYGHGTQVPTYLLATQKEPVRPPVAHKHLHKEKATYQKTWACNDLTDETTQSKTPTCQRAVRRTANYKPGRPPKVCYVAACH